MTLDTLTFARRLKSAGFSEAQAEALADANRDMLADDVATKSDIADVRRDIEDVRRNLEDVRKGGDGLCKEFDLKIDQLRKDLEARIDTLGMRLTIRMGVMLGGAVAILGGIIRLP